MRFIAIVLMLSILGYGGQVFAGRVEGYSLHEKDGKLRSLFTTTSFTYSSSKVLRGVRVSLPPVGTSDVVVALDDYGSLVALRAGSGEVLWRRNLPTGGIKYSAALAYSQGVVLCSVDNHIYGIDLRTGDIKWDSVLSSFLSGNLVFLNDEKAVAVLTTGNYLYVFDVSSGQLMWHHEEMGADVRTKGSLNVAYAPNRHGVILLLPDGKVLCLDSYSGDKVWDTVLGPERGGLVGRFNISPVVVGDEVFIVDSGMLVSLSVVSGVVSWKKDINASSITEVGSSDIYVLTDGAKGIVALDSTTKEQRWEFSLAKIRRGCGVKWNTPIKANEKLWFLSDYGCLLGVNVISGAVEESYLVPSTTSSFLYPPVTIGSSLYAPAGKKGLVVIS